MKSDIFFKRAMEKQKIILIWLPITQFCVLRQFVAKMVRGKALSNDMRNSIVAAHKNGISGHNIAKNLSISQGTVRNIITLFKNNGNIQTKKRAGRRSKITERDERALRTIIKADRRAGSREIAVKWSNAIGRRVSKDTCLRTLKKMGYGFYKVS